MGRCDVMGWAQALTGPVNSIVVALTLALSQGERGQYRHPLLNR